MNHAQPVRHIEFSYIFTPSRIFLPQISSSSMRTRPTSTHACLFSQLICSPPLFSLRIPCVVTLRRSCNLISNLCYAAWNSGVWLLTPMSLDEAKKASSSGSPRALWWKHSTSIRIHIIGKGQTVINIRY